MSDLERTAALLAAEHPDRACFREPGYLPWLYEQNPAGDAIQESVDRKGERISHVALLPQVWACGGQTAPFCVGVNGVTRAGAGRAHFLALLRRGIREMGRRGVVAGFGVTNESSTAMTLARTGIGDVGPLPVVVRPASPGGRGITTHTVTPTWLAGPELASLAGSLAPAGDDGWAQHWTVETLRWRLANPAAEYRVHVAEDAAAVTTRVRHRGVPVTVVLKLLARVPTPDRRVSAALTARACRADRSPVALYVGFNRRVAFRGVAVPRRLLPSPLNLVLFGADRASVAVGEPIVGLPQDEVELSCFELLDFDAL
ncbi:MAG: hypothetical protein KDB35_21330 [Acidimicrobiales bacterium]|nr:hypothetical protein [Acidimicrobiales bacterium]MCB1015815.1 hypothetical protein [Acidimicrobiales bacterium]